jgi:hypothetical protein
MRSIAQVLETRASTLFEKVISNNDIATAIMALIGRLTIDCVKRGRSVAGISTTEITESQGEFRFGITYHTIPTQSQGLWQGTDDLRRYVESKSGHLAKVLDANPRLTRTIRNLVESIDLYCKHHSMQFKDFKIEKMFITQNDMFVLKSKKAGKWGL